MMPDDLSGRDDATLDAGGMPLESTEFAKAPNPRSAPPQQAQNGKGGGKKARVSANPAANPAHPAAAPATRTRAPQLRDLKPDPQNRRDHPPENIAMIRRSLSDVGAARSIVIDEHDQVLAGNGVLEAADGTRVKKLRVIEADGDTVIAVRRRGLSDEQKRRLALFDNRTAELSTWNGEQLRADVADGLDLDTFFSESELAAILKEKDLVEIKRLQIARPHEVVWVLAAIPIDKWPAHQAAVAALQEAGEFATFAIRPKAEHERQVRKSRQDR
jgi:hypothetical protein